MEQEITYNVVITESGQQIPISAPAGVKFGLFTPNDPTKEIVSLDITLEEFKELQNLAVTNDIPADILEAKKAEQ